MQTTYVGDMIKIRTATGGNGLFINVQISTHSRLCNVLASNQIHLLGLIGHR